MGKITKRSTEVTEVPIAKKQKISEKKKVAPVKIEKPKKTVDPVVVEFAKKFANPEDSIQFLVENAKMPVDDFFGKHWQKAPIHMSIEIENKDLAKIFGYDYFKKLLEEAKDDEEGFDVIPERDFVFSKLTEDGNRDCKDVMEDLSLDSFTTIFEKEKYAFQFNQPQRYSDALWSFMEKLECYFGSLVGCKAFLFPEKQKIYGAEYDDVENFVIQFEGTHKWNLYKAKMELSNEHNGDVKEELCDSILEATLKPGDVLYIPKGCIYKSESVTSSSFVMLSTFQHHNIANLVDQTMGVVLDCYIKKERFLREGLPIGYLPGGGSFSNKEYAAVLKKLAETIEKDTESIPPADSMISEFMAGRLPPFSTEDFDPDTAVPPKDTDKIKLKNKSHICYYEKVNASANADEEMDEMESPEPEDLTTKSLVVMSSISNNRLIHMMVDANVLGAQTDAFSVPLDYKKVLERLMKAEEPVSLKSLEDKDTEGKDLDIAVLIRGLFNFGALEVVSK